MLKHVNSSNFKNEVLENSKVILVDFFASWCAPCSRLAPVLEKISNSRAEFDIAKIDIDESQQLAYDYNIEVVPTLIVFKNGKPVKNIAAFTDENDIVNQVSKYID